MSGAVAVREAVPGGGARQRIAVRREAIAWFRDGEALRFLLWLGTDPGKAHRMMSEELRQLCIVTHGENGGWSHG